MQCHLRWLCSYESELMTAAYCIECFEIIWNWKFPSLDLPVLCEEGRRRDFSYINFFNHKLHLAIIAIGGDFICRCFLWYCRCFVLFFSMILSEAILCRKCIESAHWNALRKLWNENRLFARFLQIQMALLVVIKNKSNRSKLLHQNFFSSTACGNGRWDTITFNVHCFVLIRWLWRDHQIYYSCHCHWNYGTAACHKSVGLTNGNKLKHKANLMFEEIFSNTERQTHTHIGF